MQYRVVSTEAIDPDHWPTRLFLLKTGFEHESFW